MSDRPRFECLEGLRGTGKSTLAPMLAEARGAVLIPTVPAEYQALRHTVDQRASVEARMCFYLSALFTATDDIQRHLEAGISVVVESYFARCLATHRAFGACLGITLPHRLPQPVTYRLDCDEPERQHRLSVRDKRTSRWDTLSEETVGQITDAYTAFPMHPVNTTGLDPHQVLKTILATDPEGVHHRADAEPVGAHPHLLSPVPRRLEGARPS
ncbi:AAA family ATPase [Streptomyces sp. NPDC001205]